MPLSTSREIDGDGRTRGRGSPAVTMGVETGVSLKLSPSASLGLDESSGAGSCV